MGRYRALRIFRPAITWPVWQTQRAEARWGMSEGASAFHVICIADTSEHRVSTHHTHHVFPVRQRFSRPLKWPQARVCLYLAYHSWRRFAPAGEQIAVMSLYLLSINRGYFMLYFSHKRRYLVDAERVHQKLFDKPENGLDEHWYKNHVKLVFSREYIDMLYHKFWLL